MLTCITSVYVFLYFQKKVIFLITVRKPQGVFSETNPWDRLPWIPTNWLVGYLQAVPPAAAESTRVKALVNKITGFWCISTRAKGPAPGRRETKRNAGISAVLGVFFLVGGLNPPWGFFLHLKKEKRGHPMKFEIHEMNAKYPVNWHGSNWTYLSILLMYIDVGVFSSHFAGLDFVHFFATCFPHEITGPGEHAAPAEWTHWSGYSSTEFAQWLWQATQELFQLLWLQWLWLFFLAANKQRYGE